MKKKNFYFLIFMLLGAGITAAQNISLTIELNTQTVYPAERLDPITLESTQFYININDAINAACSSSGIDPENDAAQVTEVKLTGTAKYTYHDLRGVRNAFPNLETVDLSEANLMDNKIQAPVRWERNWAKANGPYEYTEYSNAAIEEGAFANNTSASRVTTVLLPEGMTAIGAKAFGNCRYLTNLELPQSLNTLGTDAFNNCSALTIPNGLPETMSGSIGSGAFEGCTNLVLTTLPVGVRITGDCANAFKNCPNVTFSELNNRWDTNDTKRMYAKELFYNSGISITEIPDVIYAIQTSAFENCPNITEITFPATMGAAISGVNGIQSEIQSRAFMLPEGSTTQRTYIFTATTPPVKGTAANAFNKGSEIDTEALVLVPDAEALALFIAETPYSGMNVRSKINTISISTDGNGTVTTTDGNIENNMLDAEYGDVITFKLEPSPGFKPGSIMLDGILADLTGDEYTFTVTGAGPRISGHTFVASFGVDSSIGEISGNPAIRISPNPTADVMYVSGNVLSEIEVFDNTGRLLIKTNETTIDLSSFSQGVYFLKVNGKVEKVIRK